MEARGNRRAPRHAILMHALTFHGTVSGRALASRDGSQTAPLTFRFARRA
jgi:hypothetical protein